MITLVQTSMAIWGESYSDTLHATIHLLIFAFRISSSSLSIGSGLRLTPPLYNSPGMSIVRRAASRWSAKRPFFRFSAS